MSQSVSISHDVKYIVPERTLEELIQAGREQILADKACEKEMARNKAIAIEKKKAALLEQAKAHFPQALHPYIILNTYTYRPDGSVYFRVIIDVPDCAPIFVFFEDDERGGIGICRPRVTDIFYAKARPEAAPYRISEWAIGSKKGVFVADEPIAPVTKAETIEKALAIAAERGSNKQAAQDEYQKFASEHNRRIL